MSEKHGILSWAMKVMRIGSVETCKKGKRLRVWILYCLSEPSDYELHVNKNLTLRRWAHLQVLYVLSAL